MDNKDLYQLIGSVELTRQRLYKVINESHVPATMLMPIIEEVREKVDRAREQELNKYTEMKQEELKNVKEEIEKGEEEDGNNELH